MKFINKLLLKWVVKLLIVVSSIVCKSNNYSWMITRKYVLPPDMVYVISNCYLKNETIILSGDWTDSDFTTFNKVYDSAAALYTIGLEENLHFNKHKRLKNIYKMSLRVIRKKKYPGNIFIVMIRDYNTLVKALAMLKTSVLWNHEGIFFIICKDIEDGCRNARLILTYVWSYHILKAVFLCYGKYGNQEIYTFNPYTNSAPNFWSVSRENKENKNPWTLYRRSLDSSLKNSYQVLCQKLFFDKTVNLGGYTIKAGAYIHPRFLPYDKTKSGLERYGGLGGGISSIIWKHLNARVKVGNYFKSTFVDDNTLPQSCLRDLLKGKIEITLNINLLRDFWKLQSYPQENAGFCIVSRKPEPFNELDNILIILRPEWLMIICCVFHFYMFASLTSLMKRSCSFAFLDFIRMLSNSQSLFQPKCFIGRYLLINFAFIAMLLRIHFQSYVTSFNIVPSKSPTIDTEYDLIRSNLSIYGPLDYDEHLRDLDIKSRYRFGEYIECLERLLNGQQLICYAGCYESRFGAYEADILHISKPIRKYYMSFSLSEDWPLKSRFNQMLRSLSEVGLISHIMRKQSYLFAQNRNATSKYPKFSWKNYRAIWYFWTLGIILAVIVFLMEIFSHKIKTSHIFSFAKIK